jgi:hypothetical protein
MEDAVNTRTGLAVAVALIVALWWGVQPPQHQPTLAGSIEKQERAQCPANTELDNKLCTCPEGTNWTGSQCMQVWSSAS